MRCSSTALLSVFIIFSFILSDHSVVFTISSSGITPSVSNAHSYAASNLSGSDSMAAIMRGASAANGIVVDSNEITVNQSLENNNLYLVFTKGLWINMDTRFRYLESGEFEKFTRPSFGYPLNKDYTAVVGLDYLRRGFNIINDMRLAPGIYIFKVENMGYRNKKPIINVTKE